MATTRLTVFVSHSTADDGFVRELGRALENLQQPVWIDSREIRGGALLWPEVQAAIRKAGALAVVISPAALQSKWVADELRYAIKLQKKRRKAGQNFPVIPLSLDNTRLGFAEKLFDAEPAYIPVSTRPGGLDEALRKILEAPGLRLPAELPPTDQPSAQPVEELMLELSQLGFAEHDGPRRASARARLRYEPATPGKPHVHGKTPWTFTAPLGPIEAEELRWYLEQYAIWPSGVFHDRAEKVKQALATWGQLLHQAALPAGPTGNVLQAWAAVAAEAERRFSVYLEEGLDQDASEDERKVAREATTALLGLPWELMHDGGRFLFQGARPVRVRRRLPNTRVLDVAAVDPPIRILLVTARAEDDACLYIDHRASAKPLVQAMEHLGGLVRLSLLDPPTFPALLVELDRARQAGRPYHVVHFDGHGVYSRTEGLGGLCFEHPEDVNRLVERRHQTVYTDRLGPALVDYRIPLVFLEACQTPQAEDAAAFYRQAADKRVQLGDTAKEGRVRNNLADALRKLGRYGEARQEIRRAIACGGPLGHAAEPWKTWALLAAIEFTDGQPAAAAAARQKAIELFLAYRHDGGENHEGGGRLCAAVTTAMLAGNIQQAADMLAELRSRPNLPACVLPLLDALEAILGGRRDPSLAQSTPTLTMTTPLKSSCCSKPSPALAYVDRAAADPIRCLCPSESRRFNFRLRGELDSVEISKDVKSVLEVMPMNNTYIVTGTLTDDRTVTLDEALPLMPMKVRLVVEPLRPVPQRPYLEVMADIRQRQRARGHQPPAREEVDAYLQAERDSWGD